MLSISEWSLVQRLPGWSLNLNNTFHGRMPRNTSITMTKHQSCKGHLESICSLSQWPSVFSWRRGEYRLGISGHSGDCPALSVWKLCRRQRWLASDSLRSPGRNTLLKEQHLQMMSSDTTSFLYLWSLPRLHWRTGSSCLLWKETLSSFCVCTAYRIPDTDWTTRWLLP